MHCSIVAKLPTLGTLTGSSWVEKIGQFFVSGVELAAFILMIVFLLTVSYTLLAKFGEWKNGRAELGDIAALAVVGAVILIIVIILLVRVMDIRFSST